MSGPARRTPADVAAARATAERAAATLRDRVREAVEAGATKKDVAEAAGVTRQTLDRWLGAWQRS